MSKSVFVFATVTVLLLFYIKSTSCQFRHKYNVIVNCRHGAVEGFSIPSHYEAYDRQRINVFLGVPYAKRIPEYSDWRRQFRFNVISDYFVSKIVAPAIRQLLEITLH